MTADYYKTINLHSGPEGMSFVFYSTGKKRIGKVVLYSFLDYRSGRLAYNLGFGDFDEQANTVYDSIDSDNDDMRIVFNTVAHTVPIFFEKHPESIIVVQGSDTEDERFSIEQQCRPTCRRKCQQGHCKRAGRRIRTYRWFVDKYFYNIVDEYLIFGSYKDDQENFVQYVPGEDYVSLMVYRKNSLNFAP